MSQRQIDRIFPGHGMSASKALLNEIIEYLKFYLETLPISKDANSAVKTMQTRFPNYKMERFLAIGLDTYIQKH